MKLIALATLFCAACAGSPVAPEAISTSSRPEMAQVWPLRIALPGSYPQHLQGVAVDHSFIYWSMTDRLIKTDTNGLILLEVTARYHHGDICVSGERLRAAVNFGDFNNPAGGADSWIYQYTTSDLRFIERTALPEATFGAGGIACRNDKIIVVGGLPRGATRNRIYELNPSMALLAERPLDTGYTDQGLQTATFGDGSWWLGSYGDVLFRLEDDLQKLSRFNFDAAIGLVSLGNGAYYAGRQSLNPSSGLYGDTRVERMTLDPERGLTPASTSANRSAQ